MVRPSSKRPAADGDANGLTENSPLIPKSPSTSFAPADEIIDRGDTYSDGEEADKGREVEIYKPGKSSFSQTVCPILLSHAQCAGVVGCIKAITGYCLLAAAEYPG
jgi:hypothetical protein